MAHLGAWAIKHTSCHLDFSGQPIHIHGSAASCLSSRLLEGWMVMSSIFDPYHLWLGIPPSEHPLNHYRLLGIELFEQKLLSKPLEVLGLW